ncbi:hypothetical protein [Jonesia denitrificans]|uniref:Uncharacterized protein n=1 Tax=Jonesia denitrificans (strain ATCC 14870 / DSM 20603 / BCRC 15368 / CIP 55.134 / JCM 11481 / NBRC 15587 / NCTC 10816 / Prevot 55134) TaxID=471856 RepID=C7R0F2_JONDD|nr:hypothetical protein [Jonesia denitrificans]ACV09616.1 hypothetical protein Jden_1977 [Jonesia denitrificans DSM 20603]ASE09160.1 hypothetical protein CEP80_08415 [Jonesia denitrificans]QXB43704.1 hypothetical protein I6L70_02070 [Jonesia denitrificans]SQH22088.1 Uncharacterised protein [Jonesia denitrificans]
MNTPEPQTPTPVWKTIMWPAAALAISQSAYFLIVNSELVWYVLPIVFIGPILIPLGAFILMIWKSKPAPPLYALLVLPVALYAAGIASCIFVWLAEGAPVGGFPLDSGIWTSVNPYRTYGVQGVTAGIVWVGCLLRTLKYTLTAHHAKTRTEG